MRESLCDTRYAICDTRYAICDMRYAICDMRYAIRDMRYAIRALHLRSPEAIETHSQNDHQTDRDRLQVERQAEQHERIADDGHDRGPDQRAVDRAFTARHA